MGNLFGRKKKESSRITEQDKAVLQLKQQRDKLKQYTRKLEVQLEKERQLAKQLLKEGKKDKAKLLLRKKKFVETTISKTDSQLENIDKLISDIEYAQVETQVVRGLQAGNEALKQMHRLMSIEDVERIMDETQESIEYQREIDDILSGGLSDQEEEDVLAELNDIIEADADVPLPDVPTHELDDSAATERIQQRPEARQRVALEA